MTHAYHITKQEESTLQRYGTTPFILIRQPRPADRESRLHLPKDHTLQRPRKEMLPHV